MIVLKNLYHIHPHSAEKTGKGRRRCTQEIGYWGTEIGVEFRPRPARGCVLKDANPRGLEAGLRVGARLMRLMLSLPRSCLVVSLSDESLLWIAGRGLRALGDVCV